MIHTLLDRLIGPILAIAEGAQEAVHLRGVRMSGHGALHFVDDSWDNGLGPYEIAGAVESLEDRARKHWRCLRW